MILGNGSVIYKGLNQTVPPFPATAAENGVSVDPVTGRIVLGNNAAAVLAILLSNREIPMATFFLRLLYAAGQNITFLQQGALDLMQLIITDAATTRGLNIEHTLPGLTYTGLRIKQNSATGGAEIDLANSANNGMFVSIGGPAQVGQVNLIQNIFVGAECRYNITTAAAFFRWQTQSVARMSLLAAGLRVASDVTPSAKLSTDGSISGGRPLLVRNITPFNITNVAHAGYYFSNEGAIVLIVMNLPALSGASFEQQHYKFIIQNVNGFQIVAAAGDTIRIAGAVSVAGGTCTSVVVGSALVLQGINATEWVASSVVGVWTIP